MNILKESLNILVDVVKMVMISKSSHHAWQGVLSLVAN